MNIIHFFITGGLMRQSYENRFAMVETTVALLEKNRSLWQGNPAFVRAMAELLATVAAIRTESGKQQTPTTGATASKAQARDALEDMILELADQLSALAAATKNVDLAPQVEFTRSALDKLSDDELEAVTERIAMLTSAHLAPLADYLVSQDNVTELLQLKSNFMALKTAPRSAIVQRSSATASLPDLLTTASRLLREQIDKLISKFRSKQPEFVARYRAARVIVDCGGRNTVKETTTPVPATAPAA